jgi:heme-degrading monooxygenase HmoA
MRTRLSAARKASGWVGGQLLRPADKPDRRVIVGTWRTRANWEAWAAPANLQVFKQAEGEGQDEEPTKALGLTIPSSTTRHDGTAARDALGRAREAEQAAPLPRGAGLTRSAQEGRTLRRARTARGRARGAVGGGATGSEVPGPSPNASASAPSAAVGVESHGGRDPNSLNPHSALKLSNSIASRRRSVMSITFGPCFEMFM